MTEKQTSNVEQTEPEDQFVSLVVFSNN